MVDSKGRSAVTTRLSTIGICFGVMTLITVLSVMNGFQLQFIDSIIELSSYHVQVALGEDVAGSEETKNREETQTRDKVVDRADFSELESYLKSDKKTVLGIWGCVPEKKGGKYLPYNQWKECKDGDGYNPISFFGGYGTCYPPHLFDQEILNSKVFLSLCPKADDIWFWAMEERQGIRRQYISPKGYGYHQSVNRVFDYNVGGDGCLTLSNVLNGENDRQLRNVLDRYKLD